MEIANDNNFLKKVKAQYPNSTPRLANYHKHAELVEQQINHIHDVRIGFKNRAYKTINVSCKSHNH